MIRYCETYTAHELIGFDAPIGLGNWQGQWRDDVDCHIFNMKFNELQERTGPGRWVYPDEVIGKINAFVMANSKCRNIVWKTAYEMEIQYNMFDIPELAEKIAFQDAFAVYLNEGLFLDLK